MVIIKYLFLYLGDWRGEVELEAVGRRLGKSRDKHAGHLEDLANHLADRDIISKTGVTAEDASVVDETLKYSFWDEETIHFYVPEVRSFLFLW